MPFQFDYGIIGGDRRQVYCAELLADQGYKVCTYALKEETAIFQVDSLEDIVKNSKNLIGAIPFTRNKKELLAFTDTKDLAISYLAGLLCKGQQLFAGCIPEDFLRRAEEKGVICLDLMDVEGLAYFNSIATAEGIIAEAIIKSPVNLSKSRCLVLGYGRCGKTLCTRLKGLSCKVTVCARSERAKAEAAVEVENVVGFEELAEEIKTAAFVFNTVPSPVLNQEILEKAAKDTLILDIASGVGGIDFEAADRLGIKAFLCPGLPGKYAPKASALGILDTILYFKGKQ